MPAPGDLIHQQSTSIGTGDITLTAVNGKRSFNDEFGTGGTNKFDYFISNQAAAEWERGTGHLSAPTTLVRDTVLSSSNANAAVNFSAGTKDVANDVPAAKQVTTDDAQTLTNKTFDTAGAGNVLKVNGTQISDKTGTGKVVLDNAPTLTNPIVGNQSARDNSTKAASTAYADAQVDQATISNPQTGSYTAVLADAGRTIRMNVASGNNLTIPANASVAYPVDTYLNVEQYGAGQTTLVADTGVTIRSRNGLKLGGQYAMATLHKIATNEWIAGGDLTT